MKKSILLLLISLIVFSACSDSSSSGSSTPTPSGAISEFTSDCGTVVFGDLQNPVNADRGELVDVSVVDSNVFIITSELGSKLVALHSLKQVPGYLHQAAMNLLEGLATEQAVFFQASEDCVITAPGGGTGTAGQLVSVSGRNYSEELIKAGFASINTLGSCSSNMITGCYQSLAESSVQLGASISNFLWKPQSDSDGSLVILFNPANASVVVNGELLRPTGASNGRGTTARGDRSGCAYGAGSVVQAYDASGRVLVFPGGAQTFTIADGCQRVEF